MAVGILLWGRGGGGGQFPSFRLAGNEGMEKNMETIMGCIGTKYPFLLHSLLTKDKLHKPKKQTDGLSPAMKA